MAVTNSRWTEILALSTQLETLATNQLWDQLGKLLRRRDKLLRDALAAPLVTGDGQGERKKLLEAIAAADQRVLEMCEIARSDVAERLRVMHSGQTHVRDYARAAKLPST